MKCLDKLHQLHAKSQHLWIINRSKQLLELGKAQYQGCFWSINKESLAVSVPTIYRAVQSGRLPFDARKHLRRRGKPYRRKTRQDGRVKSEYPIDIPAPRAYTGTAFLALRKHISADTDLVL